MQVQSLGGEFPPEKEMTTHFSILAWEIPWIEEPGGLQSMGVTKSDTTWQLNNYNTKCHLSKLKVVEYQQFCTVQPNCSWMNWVPSLHKTSLKRRHALFFLLTLSSPMQPSDLSSEWPVPRGSLPDLLDQESAPSKCCDTMVFSFFALTTAAILADCFITLSSLYSNADSKELGTSSALFIVISPAFNFVSTCLLSFLLNYCRSNLSKYGLEITFLESTVGLGGI